MKPKLNATIIGAGGVTSYLLPALVKSFDLNVCLIDGDKLEKKNLDRQLFRTNDIGQFKGPALLRANTIRKAKGASVSAYFDLDMLETEAKFYFGDNCDVIICAADNHPARRDAVLAADLMHKPLIIAANEYSTSQAFIYHPDLKGAYPNLHPFIRYPEIETSNEGSPIRCQGDALESTPQLAIANQVAASFANYLVWNWFSEAHSYEDHLPVEFQSTFSRLETVTLKDCE